MPDVPATFVPDIPSTFVPDKEELPVKPKDFSPYEDAAGFEPTAYIPPGEKPPSLFQSFFPLPNRIEGETPLGQFGAALANTAIDQAGSALSPGGLMTLPLGGLGKIGSVVAGAGFGVPAFVQGVNRVYKGTALGEPQEAMEGALQALTGGLITGGAVHGLTAKSIPKTFIPEAEKPPIIPPPKLADFQPPETAPVNLEIPEKAPPTAVTGEASPTAPAVSAAEVPVPAGTEPAKSEPTVTPEVTQGHVSTPSGPQMGAAGYEEVKPTGTGLKNAVGEMERVGLGLEEAPETVKRNMAAAWEVSGQVEASAPGTGKALADSLISNPERGLTDADSALLLRHKADLWNKLNDAAERTHVGDEASRSAAQSEYDALVNQYGNLLDAVNKRGSEWGREGRWRQAMAKEDFTFSSTEDINRYHRTLTGKDLPKDKIVRATKKAKEVKQAQIEADKASNAIIDDLKGQTTPPTPEEVVKRKQLEDQSKVAKEASDAATVAVRDASKAQTEAEAEAKSTTGPQREVARRKARTAKTAVVNAEKVKQAADKALKKAQGALAADPVKAVWSKVKELLDKGETDQNEIRNKVATELGMSVDTVTRIMAQKAKTKRLLDDAWLKQQKVNSLRQNARNWVKTVDLPAHERFLSNIPKWLFALKVGFHGTVALGTHAPTVAFQPRFWSTYVRDFGKMYKMVGSPAYFERQVQDLVRRKNYVTARRAGLVNDPKVYEDFSSPDTAKYFGRLTGMGNRGYTVLKVLRQDMFDQMYNRLPESLKSQEGVASALADEINHATGVVQGRAPKGTNLALFAPRLEGARIMQLAGDPIRMTRTFANWDNASTGDKVFAINQIKEKAWIMGTFFSLLALNQGFLSATGSKQKINGIPKSAGGAGFDPLESDFLKFKVADHDVAYGSAIVNLAKLPVRLATALMYHGKTSKLVLEDERMGKIAQDYIRSQLSPFAGTTADLLIGRDYAGRPLPRAGFGLLPGRTDVPKRLRMHGVDKPYTWSEYSAQQFTPIPISEAIRETWKHGLGMSDKQIDAYLKAWAVGSFMAGTGARVTEDRNIEGQ